MKIIFKDYKEEIEKLNLKEKLIRYTGRDEGYKSVYNLGASFDIETTNTRANNNMYGFMYVWQFSINKTVFMGRTWEEFKQFINDLVEVLDLKTNKLFIYIHNLAYEFQFMKHQLKFNNAGIFANRNYNVIIANLEGLGVEFRDSYILSNLSLENLAKELKTANIRKLNTLDYNKIRTPKTPLSEEELAYCCNDVLIVEQYINEQIELYEGDINKIPLTNTGRVRKLCRNNLLYERGRNGRKYVNKSFKDRIKYCKLGLEDYLMLKRVLGGGFNVCSDLYKGLKLENVKSWDEVSAYMSIMLSERLPMGAAKEVVIENDKQFYDILENKNMLSIFDIRFNNLKIKDDKYIDIMTANNCIVKGKREITDRKITYAEELTTSLTSIDFKSISKFYNWDSIEIGKMYYYTVNYLPKEFINIILELYKNKTELKGIDEYKYLYDNIKSMFNAVFGMTITDIAPDKVIYDNGKWETVEASLEEIKDDIEKFNNSFNRFVYYPWGVFTMAYARQRLFNAIDECGEDLVYSDTDSVKMVNYEKHENYFRKFNEEIKAKLYKMCDFYALDYSLVSPKNKEGKEKLIGSWENDGNYKEFKALGTKKYAAIYDSGKFEITVAGLNKEKGTKYIYDLAKENEESPVDTFKEYLVVPKGETGTMTHFYLEDEFTIDIEDYNGVIDTVSEKSYIYLEECSFMIEDQGLSELKEIITGIKILDYQD